MGYPTDRVLVYDRGGAFLGELQPEDQFSRVRVEEINGEHELTIATTRPLAEGSRLLTCDATGKWREHVVYRPDQAHERGEHAIGTYACMWSLQYDLMGTYASEHAEPGMGSSCTGTAAVRAALDGQTRWEAGSSDVASVAAGNGCVMIGMSAWDRLKLVVERWHGEVDARIVVDETGVTHRYVDLLAHLGSETARRRFDWGADLKAIRRIPDPSPYYCRVVPLGRGQREYAEDDETEFDWPLDISEETGGTIYIEDSEAVAAFRTKNPDGTYSYPTKVVHYDEDDPELLYNAALADLHNHTRPNVQYEADVLQFAQAGMDAQGVALGDNTDCADRGFNPDAALGIEGRVQRMEVEELSPDTRTTLTLGSLGTSWATTLRDLMGESTRSVSEHVKRIERGGTLTYFETLVDQLNEAINAMGGWTYTIPGEGVISYDREVADPLVGTEATSVTQIKGGAMRIANSKKASFAGINDWNWRTLIVSGHIAAELVTAVQITAGYIGNANGNFFLDLDNNVLSIGNNTQIGDTTVGDLLSDVASAGISKIEYGTSASAGTTPTSWSQTAPSSVAKGSWLWIRTTYKNGSTSVTKAYAGTDGQNGTDGSDGVGIKSVVPQYYLSTSSSSATGGSWSSSPPTWSSGKYIWTRSLITWDTSPATTTTTTAVYDAALTQANQQAAQARTEAADAAKVATNYLTFNQTNGLDVGYDGTNAKVRVNGSGMTVYDGHGNDSLNVAASYVRVGRDGNGHSRVVVTDNGMRFEDIQSQDVFYVGYDEDYDPDEPISVLYNVMRFGLGLIGRSDWQTILGKYNVVDSSDTYALIIGGGASNSSRKNILTVDWSGNINANGGTMTGTLRVKDNAINRDASPSSTLYSDTHALDLVDKDGELAGRIRIMKAPNGTMGLQLVAWNEPDGGGTVHYNVFSIQVGKDGSKSYTMSDPAAFRSAIVSDTTTSAGWEDNTSDDGAVELVYFQKTSFTARKIYGRIVQFNLSGKLSSGCSAGGTVTLGKLPAGYRPAMQVGANAHSITRRATVNTNGNVSIQSSVAIADNATVTVTGIFMTAS